MLFKWQKNSLANNFNKYCNLYQLYDNIFFVNGIDIMHTLKHLYKNKTIFIIGGNQIYNMLLPYCSKIWLTKIKYDYDCDLWFKYDISIYTKELVYEDEELEITCLHQTLYWNKNVYSYIFEC